MCELKSSGWVRRSHNWILGFELNREHWTSKMWVIEKQRQNSLKSQNIDAHFRQRGRETDCSMNESNECTLPLF